MDSVLEIKNLSVNVDSGKKKYNIIKDLNLTIGKKMKYGIVGESGSGKSLTSLAIMNLLPEALKIIEGSIILTSSEEKVLNKLSNKEMRQVRGKDIAMIFQEPMTALDPLYTIEHQLIEVLRIHTNYGKKKMLEMGLDMLKRVGISRPTETLKSYPHQLSGGMRQRVMIAMALICQPKLLIADEPTTALDVTIQAQILDLMNELSEAHDTAILLITHDLGVIAETCERVAVMYAGQVVEETTVQQLFSNPSHPYTIGLLESIKSLGDREKDLYSIPGNVPTPPQYQEMGCRFASRCAHAMSVCRTEPAMFEVEDDHTSKCWLHVEKEVSDDGQYVRLGSQ